MAQDLFSPIEISTQKLPLAAKLRPKLLSDMVGHEDVIQNQLTPLLQSSEFPCLVFWGPPGCGKTTFVKVLASDKNKELISLSAVTTGAVELKQVCYRSPSKRIWIFIDEIHRLNKAQQDVLLEPMETGRITLFGATTENPSFSLNPALLSRLHVIELGSLNKEDLTKLIDRSFQFEDFSVPLSNEAKEYLVEYAHGDARYLLNMMEIILSDSSTKWTVERIQKQLSQRPALYDRKDWHYNLISALIKSMRGSNPDAALYWCMRMLEGGEDPLYILRRLIRFAAEDIGLAEPGAVDKVMAAYHAYEKIGSPEGDLLIAQMVIYLAVVPKSNAIYIAFNKAKIMAQKTRQLMPPKIIMNAPTKLMKEKGYGDGYLYDHDQTAGFSGQHYFPDEMEKTTFYEPKDSGQEKKIKEHMSYLLSTIKK